LVDSNVLLDVMTEDLRWLAWSAEAIERVANSFRLVINTGGRSGRRFPISSVLMLLSPDIGC
jgi:hypothetical protein